MSLTAQQLIARSRGVGCSEVWSALGKDPRCSRVELYKRKVGELPDLDFSDNERVECGTLLEAGIRELFSRKLKHPIVKVPQTLAHPTAPLVGHPDGIVHGFDDEPGIEFKNRDRLVYLDEYGEDWTDQVPLRDLVQCTGYMLLTGKRRWLLGAFVGGNERHIFEIRYDEQLAEAIIIGVTEFWSHVERREPPEPMTPDEVKLRWPKDLGTAIEATDNILAECVALNEAVMNRKRAELREADHKTVVQKYMAEHAQLTSPDGKVLATWRTAKDSERIDAKRLRAERPDVWQEYAVTQPGSRRFLLE